MPPKVITYCQLRHRGDRQSPTVRRRIGRVPLLLRPQGTCGTFLPPLFVSKLTTESMQVTPKFINSLVEIITSSIDSVTSPDVHPSQRSPPGLIENVHTPDMILRHFRNTLLYIQARKIANAGGVDPRWDEVDVVGAMLKMGLGVQDER